MIRSVLGSVVASAAVLVLGLVAPAVANTDGEKRVALVIGNASYAELPSLRNPTNDVAEVARVLREASFDVILASDHDRLALEDTVERFYRSLADADVSLLYYSGHAVQLGGVNYLVPVDASLSDPSDLEVETVSLDSILEYMRRRTSAQLVFLDACRDNPFRGSHFWTGEQLRARGEAAGLAQVTASAGTLIAFATAPGAVAYDGGGELSPFTEAFVSRATVPNEEIRALLTNVRRDVIASTRGLQVPWENSSLVEDFYFIEREAPPLVAPIFDVQAPAGRAAPISIDAPRVLRGAGVAVRFEVLPAIGRLTLEGAPVEIGRDYPGDVLQRLGFDAADAAPGAVGVAGYAVSDGFGQSAKGVIAITIVEPAAALAEAEEAQEQVRVAAARLDGMSAPTPIGVGPVRITLGAPQVVGAAITVEDVPTTGVLRLDGEGVGKGATLAPEDFARISFEPQTGTEETATRLAFVLRAFGREERFSVAVAATLDRCDALAGEPLDLGGVAEGVLPNEIDIEAALAACDDAVRRHPEVPRFLYQRGRAHLAAGDLDSAWADFEASAEAGHVRALYQLGYMYVTGAGRPVDRERANELFRRGAEQRDPYAMLSWGRALFYGRGVEPNRTLGLALILGAAEMGHTFAMNELGHIFQFGLNDVEADAARAIAYFRAGAAREDIYSYANLGNAYRRGAGVDQDYAEAMRLLTLASDGGHPGAPYSLGTMYLAGEGGLDDPARAVALLELSAERGNSFGASLRATLFDATDADERVRAVEFTALALALDNADRNDAAREQMRGYSEADKRAALARIGGRLGDAAPALGDRELDEQLIGLARADWARRNPRRDLF